MRDILILAFILFLIGVAFARPFLMSMIYIYVDLVSPQRITYYLLGSIPFSMIMAVLAVLFFLLFDEKKNLKFGALQTLMLIWMIWITFTTTIAQVPDAAWIKWSSAWKSIAFGIFLPLVWRTRQRIEIGIFFVVLCVGVITITGGVKTLAGGGGYGTLNLLVESNSGLYEGSIIATVSVALIPLIIYLFRHNTLFARSKLLKLAAGGLILSALLIPIGTEARTGLICICVLGFMLFLKAKRKLLTLVALVAIAAAAVPFLPESFTGRMSTIKTYDEDESASTRVAVWKWTLGFVQSHPLGGGFDAYLINKIEYSMDESKAGKRKVEDKARAYHSSWFETLGGHGYPGFLLYLSMFGTALWQLRGVAKRYKIADAEHAWMRDLANALSQALIIFMAGSTFVGIAFQTILYILFALSASVVQYARSKEEAENKVKAVAAKPVPLRLRPALR